MTIVEPINFVDGSDPGVAIKKVRPANTDLTFLAGALGIEPRSAVLETAILTAVLCPCTIDYCTILSRRIDTSPVLLWLTDCRLPGNPTRSGHGWRSMPRET